MSTENILLNSPALKSLKRAQLVGLCKRYGLRANGKNTELIARLQEYGRSGAMAEILGPKGDAKLQGEDAGPAVETDDDDDVGNDREATEPQSDSLPAGAPRPSEAWSVVDEPMDVEANIPGGLPAIYEFGDGDKDSKKCKLRVNCNMDLLENTYYFLSLQRQLFFQIACCFPFRGIVCAIQGERTAFSGCVTTTRVVTSP